MSLTEPLRALIVSYPFPPVGGAGVQRVTKLVKYLPEHDVTPTVLTVRNPSVPLEDDSFARDLPPGLEVLRARTLEPSYAAKARVWQREKTAKASACAFVKACLIPDPQVLWVPDAARALLQRLAGRDADDVVFVSGPPFSAFVLGALARLKPGTAVVLDYRDEWSTTRTMYEMAHPFAARAGARLESALVRSAHAITTATAAFRSQLLARFPFLDPASVRAIENGYDEADFQRTLPDPPRDRFVLTYAGTVFRLTSARGLLQAVRLLHAREPELARLLELRFVGRVVDTELDAFEGSEALGVVRTGYVSHQRVIDALAESHAVLCLLDDVPGTERIFPAKIFELMRLGRPCLTLAPSGALSELVERHQAGVVLPPHAVAAIADRLSRWLSAFRDGRAILAPRARDVERFDRRRQAGEFRDVFAGAVARARLRSLRKDCVRPEISMDRASESSLARMLLDGCRQWTSSLSPS